MFYRITSLLGLGIVLVALWAQPLAAGGWAVVTLHQLPIELQAGRAVSIGFQAMQHGIHPLQMADGEVTVVAWQLGSSDRIEIPALSWGLPGHYSAELVLPRAGTWEWEVRLGDFGTAPMPALTVSPSQLAPAEVDTAPLLVVAEQPVPQDWRWMLGQILAWLQAPVPQIEASSSAPVISESVADEELVAYGKALFQAKGCVTCHVHEAMAGQLSVSVGPELSNYLVIPEYVSVWLRNPKAIKPETAMPTLPLNDAEIEALVAFLSAE